MGPFLCVASAVGFGLMAIFAKLAYGEGATVDALLVVRFGLAGSALLVVAASTGALRRLGPRQVAAALAMGGLGYAAQAGLYLAAVSRVDASQVGLAFSVYPVLVMVSAILIGRERSSARRLVALAMAMGGLVLVLGGVGGVGFEPAGALLALGSAVVYSCYILVGDRVVAGVPPVPLTALVCTGAFVSCTVASLLTGGPDLTLRASAWGWLAALALVSTVGAILMFFAGLARVGPTVASLLSVTEPVVTVVAAALVFGESLTVTQVLGGVLVLAAVVTVQWPRRRTASRGHGGPGTGGEPLEAATRPAVP